MCLSTCPKGGRSRNERIFSYVINDRIFAKANRTDGVVSFGSTLGVQGCGLKAKCESRTDLSGS